MPVVKSQSTRRAFDYYRELVQVAIADALDAKTGALVELGRVGQLFATELRRSLDAGGKRIRGSLVIMAYEGYGGDVDEKEKKAIGKAAAAMELVNQYLLIHDDVIDQDDLRRGALTSVAALRERLPDHLAQLDPKRFGDAQAIVFGDLVNALAFELLAEAEFPNERRIKAIGLLARVTQDVTLGEFLDVEFEKDFKSTQKIAQNTALLKTSSYTITGPMQLGAVLAGVHGAELEKIASLGAPLGLAFQLQDDYLGLFGTEESFGKPIGSDLEEGQMTPLLLVTIARATTTEVAFLKRVVGKKMSKKDRERIYTIMERTNAQSHVKEVENRYFEQSLGAIDALGLSVQVKEALTNLVKRLQMRET